MSDKAMYMRLMDELGREPTEEEMNDENARLIDEAYEKDRDEKQ